MVAYPEGGMLVADPSAFVSGVVVIGLPLERLS
jgi:hypothetical protein